MNELWRLVHRGGEDWRLEAINVPHGDLPERGVGELFEKGKKIRCALSSTPLLWRPDAPLVDEAWHAMCQAIYKRVEGALWENLYLKWR